MIFDFKFLENKEKIPKVVIVGSGPAGITLSKKLAELGVSSLILEAGGESFTEQTHETSKGKVIGDDYFPLDQTHLKFFGGTSNHWTGVCRPLDEVDFLPRDDVDNYIGWPIRKSDIDPYYNEARKILELKRMRETYLDEDLKEIEFAMSPPVRFGAKYRPFLKKSDKANVCLNAYVTSIIAQNGNAKKIEVKGPNQQTIYVDTKYLIVCAGGIDNSRLLLWSNQVSNEPLIKNDKVLGKYWFEHPHDMSGEALTTKHFNSFTFPYGWVTLSPTKDVMLKYNILNASLRLHGGGQPKDRIPKLHTIPGYRHLVCTSTPISTKVLDFLGRQKVDCVNRIEMVWEQQPREHNKVTLSVDEKDAYGVPRPVLHWEKSVLDYRTPKVVMELLGRYLLKNKLGYIKLYEHLIEEKAPKQTPDWMAGCHHMGGTRMSQDPIDGVVDQNLKIHGINNAYVLGSSVFPSGGHANPTFTVVQLSLRLAEHISKVIKY